MSKFFKSTEIAARVSSFIGGDGSMIAQIKLNKTAGYVMGHQIQCTLQITQATVNKKVLEEIQTDLGGVGKIRDRKTASVSDLIITEREVIYAILTELLPHFYEQGKKQQALLMQRIIVLMRDPMFSKEPIKFLAICELADTLSSLNYSKKRTVTAESVRTYLRDVKRFDV